MKPPTCPYCKASEWRHVCGASNKPITASNAASNVAKPDSRHQRWSRAAYNAYMKRYMAMRREVERAVKAGIADWWPRRGVE